MTWFRKQRSGYQTRINALPYMEARRTHERETHARRPRHARGFLALSLGTVEGCFHFALKGCSAAFNEGGLYERKS